MGLGSSCSVEIEVSNKTRNITLKAPRTHVGRGRCSKRPLPELFPRSSDTCSFSGDPKLWGVLGTTDVKGILVYEAESFTLAIYFYNSSELSSFSPRLGLELSPGKAHLGDLWAAYCRMAHGTYSSSGQDIEFARVTVGRNHGTARLSHGPIKVMAAMSYDTSSTLKVVLEKQKESGEEAQREKPRDVTGDRSKRNEILLDLVGDIMDSPGSA